MIVARAVRERGLMEFKAAISTADESDVAVREACEGLADIKPDLVMVFMTHHHGPFEPVLASIWDRLNARNLIGCTGAGIIGPDREVEGEPAIAVWAAHMPGVRILPFVLDQQDVAELETAQAWHDHLSILPDENPAFVILPDPYSIDTDACLRLFDAAYPAGKIVGGMASGGSAPGENKLFLNDQVLRQGMVGVSLSGPVEIHTVVSQGCRPVGEPFVVTKARHNVIYELRGKPALDVLQAVYNEAAPEDRALMQKGLHVGNVVDERLSRFGTGDFLVRNLLGVVDETGLAVNALVRPGQTVQFHVRDSDSADEEMRRLLARKVAEMREAPGGGLLFSCNGRGVRMFGKPNHDIAVVNTLARLRHVAGFFAAGEIGPVGQRTFIHGFTSSLVLFHEKANRPVAKQRLSEGEAGHAAS